LRILTGLNLRVLVDHQIRNPLKKSEKVSKGSLRNLAGLEVGAFKNFRSELHSRMANKCQNVKNNY
jgi:hypothetical protein